MIHYELYPSPKINRAQVQSFLTKINHCLAFVMWALNHLRDWRLLASPSSLPRFLVETPFPPLVYAVHTSQQRNDKWHHKGHLARHDQSKLHSLFSIEPKHSSKKNLNCHFPKTTQTVYPIPQVINRMWLMRGVGGTMNNYLDKSCHGASEGGLCSHDMHTTYNDSPPPNLFFSNYPWSESFTKSPNHKKNRYVLSVCCCNTWSITKTLSWFCSLSLWYQHHVIY